MRQRDYHSLPILQMGKEGRTDPRSHSQGSVAKQVYLKLSQSQAFPFVWMPSPGRHTKWDITSILIM